MLPALLSYYYQLYYRFCCQVVVICWNDAPEEVSDSPGFWFLGTTLARSIRLLHVPATLLLASIVIAIAICSKCLVGTTVLSYSIVLLCAKLLH